jgi:tRNA(Ile)-lysidine synthase
MQEFFIKYIEGKALFKREERILLAVSGGIDSMVMCDLFSKADFQFGIAHCNFQLRGKESDEDERFVREVALKINAAFFVKQFNTAQYAAENKISIQMAARKLRYQWFNELLEQNNFTYLSTAHHKDDVIETFFINLVRGTGIAGLSGITEKRNNIIRPLLFTDKAKIIEYAKEKHLAYREDSSNLCDKYMRNKIRHHIIPLFKELNPNAFNNSITSIGHLKDVGSILLEKIETIKPKVLSRKDGQIKLSIKELKKLRPLSICLFELLKEFGFNSQIIKEIESHLKAESGKKFYSAQYKLVKDRDFLIIVKQQFDGLANEALIDERTPEIITPIHLKFKVFKKDGFFIPLTSTIASLDMNKLKFPLLLRKWKQGDRFQPFGMKGQKLLSDFFVDQKLSLIDKENIWVLCSDNEIAWIVGYRISDKFKITDNCREIFNIEFLQT